MKKKKKNSEISRLILQIRLTCQIWDSCHESLITEQEKNNLRVNPEIAELTRQTRNPCHESLITK